jgi:hypothetical protein
VFTICRAVASGSIAPLTLRLIVVVGLVSATLKLPAPKGFVSVVVVVAAAAAAF